MKKIVFAVLSLFGLVALSFAATTGIITPSAALRPQGGIFPNNIKTINLTDATYKAADDSIFTGECKYIGPFRMCEAGGPAWNKLNLYCPKGTVEADDSLKIGFTSAATESLSDTILSTVNGGIWTAIVDTSLAGGYKKTALSILPGQCLWFRILASEGAGAVRISKSIRIVLESPLTSTETIQ
jgi:hypothetical protein